MITDPNWKDRRLLGWFGSVPFYLTTLLVIIFCAAAAIEAIFRGFGVSSSWMLFSPELAFHRFQLWRVLSYPFFNEPSIWFLLEMGMLFLFGREVERYLGRRSFLFLYLILLFIPPTIISLLQLLYGATPVLSGSWNIHFAVFVSFVALYPQSEIFFGIAAKWVAVALISIRSLEVWGSKDWFSLAIFWLECAVAVLFIRLQCFGGLELLNRLRRGLAKFFSFHSRRSWKQEIRSKDTLNDLKKNPSDDIENFDYSVDRILEKISRRGLGSLTLRERDCLEKARAALLEKEKR